MFFYDQLNRKKVEVNALGTYTAYTYDADGNVTNIKIYETTVTVPANGGASSSAPAAPSGNKRETSFTYDGLNHLLTSSVVLPSGYKTGVWNGTAWTNATTTSLDTPYGTVRLKSFALRPEAEISSSNGGRSVPLRKSGRSEVSHCSSGSEMALDSEGIVDRGVG